MKNDRDSVLPVSLDQQCTIRIFKYFRRTLRKISYSILLIELRMVPNETAKRSRVKLKLSYNEASKKNHESLMEWLIRIPVLFLSETHITCISGWRQVSGG